MKYTRPELELILFKEEDIVATSYILPIVPADVGEAEQDF